MRTVVILLTLALAAGCEGPTGPPGDPGDPGDPGPGTRHVITVPVDSSSYTDIPLPSWWDINDPPLFACYDAPLAGNSWLRVAQSCGLWGGDFIRIGHYPGAVSAVLITVQ